MQFSTLVSIFGSAALVAATNTVTFKSLDNDARTVYFTPSAGFEEIAPVQVSGGQDVTTEIPTGWIGNWHSVTEGQENVPGMLGEVAFQGWNGLTYFDVSAIVDPNDHSGVKEIWPASSRLPTSGCEQFPCDNAYYLWDDVQTKVTSETDIICTLGNGPSPLQARESESVKRNFVEGKF